MVRRILTGTIAAVAIIGALAIHARPVEAAGRVYELWRDKNGNYICAGECTAKCCQIIEL
jgi:hypothetical protein